MCIYTRRLQILLDDRRYRRVAATARARKISVAEVIREAIDRSIPDEVDRKRAAGRALLDAAPIDVPDAPEELKAEFDEIRAGARS